MNNKYQIPTAIAFIAMILLYINSNLFAYDDWELVKGPFCGHFTCFGEDLNKKLFAGSWGDGLYQLSSDGSTWTKVSTNLADPYITCIFIDSSNKIYVGSNGNGVSVSTNSGVNWTKIASGLTNLNIKSIIKNASNHLLAATNGSGVFRSTNNGTSWVESNTGLWFRDVNALIKCNTGAIIAATNGGGFYNSTDGGISWRKSNAATSGSVIKLEFAYQLAMQTDGSVFATTPNRGVLYSVDNGLSWDEQDTTNYINFNTNAIAFNKKRYTVAGTRTNGVIYHDDLVYSAWAQSNMKQIAPDAIIRASSGTLYAAFPMKGIYKSTNDATDWVKQSFGTYNSGIIGLTTYKNGIMFAGRDWGGAFISTDYGNTWTSAGLNSYRAGFFAFDSSGNVLAATNKGLYKSTDKGTSWALLGLRDSISFISVTPSGVLFVIDSVLQKSTDNGTTWSIITLAHGLKGDPIPTLNVATNKNGDVYAFVPGEGIYKAPNPGTSFLNVNNSLEAGLRNYGIVFNNAGHIYCSVGQFGVLLSTDNGTNWTLDTLGAKLHNTVGVAFNSRSVPYAITTDGGGIWEKNTVNNWNPYNTNIELWDMQSITSNEKGYMYVTTDAVYMLRDSNKLAIPTLISPASGTTNVDIQIPFSWNPATDIETFEFQLSDDKDFKTTIEYRTQAQTIDNNEKLFDFATKYYWRVRTKFNSHVGEWSEIRSFTTVAAPPVLISPINNSRGIRRSHDLIWHTVPNVNKYEYQVATDTIFTSVSANQIINADTTATITLKDYTVYHWRARSVVGTGIFSPWSKYNTYLTAVAPPQLTSPADKSSGMDTVVVMTWDTSVASTKYIILISKSPDFSPDSIIYEGTTDENNRHRMPLLQFNKTYWWKIKAGNDDGYGEFCDPWSYTTGIKVPLLASPADSITNQPINLTIKWNNLINDAKQHIQVSKDPTFKTFLINDSSLSAVSYDLKNLEYYTKYYWRASNVKGSIQSFWSSTWAFKTTIPTPVAVYPAKGDTTKFPLNFNISWNQVPNATLYHFQISTDPTFADIVKDTSNMVDIFIKMDSTLLKYNTTYYCHVDAKNKDSQTPYSEIFSFTTKSNINKSVRDNIPEIGSLSAYPNPFAGELRITLNLKKAARVNMSIVDISGNKVEIITNNALNIGNNELIWKPEHLSQGKYFLNAEIDGTLLSRELIYLK